MTDKCERSVFTKPRIVARTKCPLTCSASSCSRATPSARAYSWLVCWCQALSASSLVSGTSRYFLASLVNVGYSFFLALHQAREFLSASKGSIWWWFGHVWRIEKEKAKWKFNVKMFTLFDVKMIQICTFPAAPSTERVLSLAERVPYSRYSINLRLFNWRVPGLVITDHQYMRIKVASRL